MRPSILRFTLFGMLIYVTSGAFNLDVAASPPPVGNGTHFCGVIDGQQDKQQSDQFSNRHYARTSVVTLNVGEPRTVRMIYFLPNDRPYRAEVVQKMKDEILNIQTFFAEQMIAHGYGELTFRIETDSQGEPIVHRVDGQHPDSHYLDDTPTPMRNEFGNMFDFFANIYFVVIDNSIDTINLGGSRYGGIGHRNGKSGGEILVSDEFFWKVAAHELGHAFGLSHDFRDGAYIMSYDPRRNRLSACDAEYLSVHPYFNPDTPIEEGELPTIELISPRAYPAGSQSVPIKLKINDSEGLHQVLLRDAVFSLVVCRGLAGEKNAVVEFDYDGVFTAKGFTSLSDLVTRRISVEAVDTHGNSRFAVFTLIIPENRVGANVEVNIPDPHLRAAVAEAIGVLPSDSIIRGWIAQLTYLNATEANISDLTGIEFATRLKGLGVWSNSISDISPLAGLTNLRTLHLRKNRISDISPLAGLTNLQELNLNSNSISDISPLAGLTNLSVLNLSDNNISDISALAGLTRLSWLYLSTNNISNLSPVAGLTKLKKLHLRKNRISDISPLVGLTKLFELTLDSNFISDISPLIENRGLWEGDFVHVSKNPLSPVSIHTHIPTLQRRGVTVAFTNRTLTLPLKILGDNQRGAPGTTLEQPFVVELRDQNGVAFAGVSVTFAITAGDGTLSVTNTITDENGRAQSTLTLGGDYGTNTVAVSVKGISQTALFRAEATPPPPIPTTLKYVSGNNQSGLTGEVLMQPFVVEVHDQYDDPMEGVTVTFAVSIGGGLLSDTSVDSNVNGLARSTLTLGNAPVTNIVEVSVEGIAETVTFRAVAELLDFDLALPSGINLIHVPLKAPTFGDEAEPIESVSALYNALGGESKVHFLATYDSQTQQWAGYFGPEEKRTSADRGLADDTGILANMIDETSVHLTGKPLGTNGTSTITLTPEFNVVGLPLRDSGINYVSDLLTLAGIKDNVNAIIFTDKGDWKLVTQAGDLSDIPIVGGQAFMLYAQREDTVTISGQGWDNTATIAAAPPVDLHSPLTGIQVTDTTSVLGLKGSIVDEGTGLNKGGFRVTVKNLSTGKAVTAVTGLDKTGYRHIIVDIETKRAATVGDILEISAQSPNPFIGVEPLRYTVTAEDVKRSLIELPELVAYEIPAETELLANYPNPFNPETWIPYRLAEDAFVTLTIYDNEGRVVRPLDVGHRIAAVYESRSKAIYWDGRNEFGEPVANGVYFYHLSAGDYAATRKMVILK